MSADLLRRAAALMRERAKAAASGTDDPWYGHPDVVSIGTPEADAQHIASWHPAVALAVADWLETTAGYVTSWSAPRGYTQALAVARAYLGDAS